VAGGGQRGEVHRRCRLADAALECRDHDDHGWERTESDEPPDNPAFCGRPTADCRTMRRPMQKRLPTCR
jgi:hypothetical protein